MPKEQKKERKPPSELTFLDLPKHLTGLSKEENTALSKKHYEEKKCKNCGNHNPKFGDHRNHECPYKMRARYDWSEDHIPIKEKNAPNFEARRDDVVAAPATLPEDDGSCRKPARSAIRHDDDGEVTTQPIIIDESEEETPMFIEDSDDKVSAYDTYTEDSDDEVYEYDTETEDAKYDGDDYSGAPTGINTCTAMETDGRIMCQQQNAKN